MADEETMNWEIPFSPVFAQVTRIPPIVIEPPISKIGKLTPEVHVGVEETIEPHEPKIGCRHCHVQCLNQYFEIVSFSKRLDRINCNRIDVLEH